MKRLFGIILLLVFVLAVPSFAQWQFVKAFPDTNYKGQAHAVVVSRDGNVWVGRTATVDSILDATSGTYKACTRIDVFKPNGTIAMQLKTISLTGGKFDTLYSGIFARGARLASDGNVLWTGGPRMYKLDSKTGAGLAKYVGLSSQVQPACDTLGEVFQAYVVPGTGPISIFSAADFSSLGTAVDSTANLGYSRSFEVSADGNDIYWAGYTLGAIQRYHSDNGSYGPYTLKDSVGMGAHCESMTFNKKDGYLYFSAGSDNDAPDSASGLKKFTWYAFNPKTNSIVPNNTIAWDLTVSPGDARPRGLAFSVTGDTAYAVQFNGSGPSCEMFVRKPASVEPINNVAPENYQLMQNYPNPFNPTTDIQFSLPKAGNTTLKVYDLLGQEVASLINENLAPGSYKVQFNASRLASGTYIYRITSGSTTITKKMMLLK
jgi:hypothetical protein